MGARRVLTTFPDTKSIISIAILSTLGREFRGAPLVMAPNRPSPLNVLRNLYWWRTSSRRSEWQSRSQ